MAKLSFRIPGSNNDDNQNRNNQNNQNENLSQQQQNTLQNNFLNQQSIENIDNSENFTSTLSQKLLVIDQFCNKIGLDAFQIPDKNKLLDIVDSQLSKQEIITNLLNELFDINAVPILSSLTSQQQTTAQNSNEKLLEQIKELRSKIDNLEEEKYLIEKKYISTIPLNDLLDNLVISQIPTEYRQEVKQLLVDAYTSNDKQSQQFVLMFIAGIQHFTFALKNIKQDEKENVDNLYKATSQLLQTIQGTTSAERRPLLNLIAEICNKFLTNYKFISPEQSLQINTEIHNAMGKGGSFVKEGLTMAVVRTDTGKTFYYAEINTK